MEKDNRKSSNVERKMARGKSNGVVDRRTRGRNSEEDKRGKR